LDIGIDKVKKRGHNDSVSSELTKGEMEMEKKRIGIIGFGLRMGNVIQREFEFFPELDVVAITDINQEPVKERITRELHTLDLNKIHFYTDAVEMLDNEDLDGVFVATRCDLHKQFAVEVLKRNIPLCLEKPVVTNLEDYAGINGRAITDIAIKVTSGTVKYRVHIKGGCWLPYVTGFNIYDGNNGYAGNGKPIDAIEVIYEGDKTAYYRVSPVGKNYFDWQRDNQVGGGLDGYAGLFGKTIDKVQIEIK